MVKVDRVCCNKVRLADIKEGEKNQMQRFLHVVDKEHMPSLTKETGYDSPSRSYHNRRSPNRGRHARGPRTDRAN